MINKIILNKNNCKLYDIILKYLYLFKLKQKICVSEHEILKFKINILLSYFFGFS